MAKYIGKRILTAIPVLFLISIGGFVMMQMMPGDAANLHTTPDMTPDQIEQVRRALGLDQPIPVQYWRWLEQALRGNLGRSLTTRHHVVDIIGATLMPTILLMGVTLIVSYILAIPLGILCAKYQGTWVDSLLTGGSFIGVSIPNFFLGLGLIYIFAIRLGWLPTGQPYPVGTVPTLAVRIRHLILPVTVLSAFYLANMTRYMRSTMIDVYGENYMRTATAKGLADWEILRAHGLRNALIPVITIIGTDLPRLVGGAIVTEQIFSWNGLGALTMTAINNRNYPILMAITMLSAVVVLLSNLLVDILYAVIDPRIRY